MADRASPREQSRRASHGLGIPPYIGGLTPFIPTTTVAAERAPSALRLAGMKTVAPGFKRSVGAVESRHICGVSFVLMPARLAPNDQMQACFGGMTKGHRGVGHRSHPGAARTLVMFSVQSFECRGIGLSAINVWSR